MKDTHSFMLNTLKLPKESCFTFKQIAENFIDILHHDAKIDIFDQVKILKFLRKYVETQFIGETRPCTEWNLQGGWLKYEENIIKN